jgi:carboxypeptidase family protein/carbohydrate esterase-like sialic acid-specific acetylesterase
MKACLIWIAALFLSASSAAQTNRGGISGTVTDKSSAVVPDVTVQITNVGTDETYRVTTSKQGAFSVQNLDPVVYRVEVDVPGFKKAIIEHVKVDTATFETVNLILEPGDQATEVRVTEQAPLQNLENGTLSQTISERLLTDVPLLNRSVLDLAVVTPNISGDGNNTITLEDVLVGEVWIVSGQSNMQFTLAESADGEAAIATANDAAIRLFNINRKVAFQHESGPLALWQPVSPPSVRGFSAAGYYFAAQLRDALHIPIGIINSSYGGTQAEAWTPVEYLLASPDLRPCVDRTKIWDEERPRVKTEYEQRMQDWREAAEKAKAEGARPPSEPRTPCLAR